MMPEPPRESYLTNEQRKNLRRIQQILIGFHRGMVSVVYRGSDGKMHVQVVSNCNTPEEQLDLAQRTLQQTQIAKTGIITTLTPEERRISEQ